MRTLKTIGGVVILALGLLLCIPVGFLAWQSFALSNSNTQHSDFILSIGSLSFSGWQMWAFVGGLACLGLILAVAAFYVLLSRQPSS